MSLEEAPPSHRGGVGGGSPVDHLWISGYINPFGDQNQQQVLNEPESDVSVIFQLQKVVGSNLLQGGDLSWSPPPR